jgi:phosphohistidine phosphatase
VRLWLLRHAKSSWDDPDLEDHERPLAPRGERAAERMAEYLSREDVRPSLVLCSSALRARQTLGLVLPALGGELEVRIEPGLYTFDGGRLIERLSRVVDDVPAVMLVGHNPATQQAALALAAHGDRLDDLVEKYPTGALVEIVLPEAAWREVGAPTGVLTRFVAPRELG